MEFIEIFRAGGVVMLPLFIISLLAVAFAVERFLAFRQFGALTPTLSGDVLETVRKGNIGAAERLVEETPGPIAASLAAVLRNRNQPASIMERRASTVREDYAIRLERFLPALDTFTTLSPLLGLLGTILGMVKVFQQFTAASADESAKARILAGVGESLYATAFGIAIAVFCFAIYNYYAARQRAIGIEAEQSTTRLISYFNGKANEGKTVVAPKGGRRNSGNRAAPLKKTKVEIIPMIDTMFFLLVFFILSSVGIIKLEGLNVSLPKAENGARQQPAQVTISINSAQQVKINSVDIPKGKDVGPYLRSEIERQVGKNANAIAKARVVISADENVENGLVVRCIDQARGVGVSQFAIATAPVDTGGGGGDTNP